MVSGFSRQTSTITDSGLLNIGAGVCNIVKGEKAFSMQIEYRTKYLLYHHPHFFIRPLFGAMGSVQGTCFLYTGLAFDLFLSKSVVITPSFAPGLYLQGKGKDLGYPIEFRSSMECAYRFRNHSRLGAMFYHLSNAHLGDKNPGTECLMIFYSIPI